MNALSVPIFSEGQLGLPCGIRSCIAGGGMEQPQATGALRNHLGGLGSLTLHQD